MRKIQFIMFVLASISVPSIAMAGDILVIESYHQGYSWDASYKKGLLDSLQGDYKLDFFQMDTKRVAKKQYQHRADLAWQSYQEKKPKLVILGDDNALKYLGPKFAETNTPVVFLGINNNPRDYFSVYPSNFTGVLERPLFKRSIATLSNILSPRPKKILLLFDDSTTARASISEAFGGSIGVDVFGVSAKLRLIKNWILWKTQIQQAKKNGYDAIIMGLYHTIADVNQKHVPASDVMAWTVENSPVPLFSFWDFSVGKGKTVGGLVLSGEEQGRMAAQIARQILQGTPPSKIYPKTAEKGRYLFSQQQLSKYELTLPAAYRKLSTLVE